MRLKDYTLQSLSEAFHKQFGIGYLPTIAFDSEEARAGSAKMLEKLLRGRELNAKLRWTAALFENEFKRGDIPDIEIDEVNSLVGLGVFACSRIKPLTLVGEYSGLVRGRRKDDNQNDYAFRYVEGRWRAPWLVDAKDQGNYCRFLNHSDEPNLLSSALIVDGTYHIIFYTKQEIEPGEQLTYDYGEVYWKRRAPPLLL